MTLSSTTTIGIWCLPIPRSYSTSPSTGSGMAILDVIYWVCG